MSEALAISAGEAHSLAPRDIRLSMGARFLCAITFRAKPLLTNVLANAMAHEANADQANAS